MLHIRRNLTISRFSNYLILFTSSSNQPPFSLHSSIKSHISLYSSNKFLNSPYSSSRSPISLYIKIIFLICLYSSSQSPVTQYSSSKSQITLFPVCLHSTNQSLGSRSQSSISHCSSNKSSINPSSILCLIFLCNSNQSSASLYSSSNSSVSHLSTSLHTSRPAPINPCNNRCLHNLFITLYNSSNFLININLIQHHSCSPQLTRMCSSLYCSSLCNNSTRQGSYTLGKHSSDINILGSTSLWLSSISMVVSKHLGSTCKAQTNPSNCRLKLHRMFMSI